MRESIDAAFYERYTPVFHNIACVISRDEALREDLIQEAWIAVLEADLSIAVNEFAFVTTIAKRRMLSVAQSHLLGEWYGRRYLSLDPYLTRERIQLTTDRQILAGENTRTTSRGICSDVTVFNTYPPRVLLTT